MVDAPAEVSQPISLGASWRLWWDYEVRRPTGGGPIARVCQIYRRREVLRELVQRGLKVKYAQSILGYAWSLVEPALLVAIYWVIFGHVARLSIQHYPLFIAAAMMPWLYFNGTLSSATTALKSNAGIIRTINLPREIYPLSIVGQECAEFIFSLPVVFVVGFGYGVTPSRWLVWLPVAIAIETVLVAGFALLLSALNTILRDIQRILRVALRVMFYLSPVVYPASRIHGIGATIYKFNPLVGIFELNRAIWYPHYGISRQVLLQHVLISAVVALAFFILGWWTFTRLERPMLKEL
jgi:ABC-2 type transport system permease protein